MRRESASKYAADQNRAFEPYGIGRMKKMEMPLAVRSKSNAPYGLIAELLRIDKVAAGDKQAFLDLFNQQIKNMVIQNPIIFQKSYWDAQ